MEHSCRHQKGENAVKLILLYFCAVNWLKTITFLLALLIEGECSILLEATCFDLSMY